MYSSGRDMKAPLNAWLCPFARSALIDMLAFLFMALMPPPNAPFISPLALSTLMVFASSLK